jgi:molybdate transport system regulatory protein
MNSQVGPLKLTAQILVGDEIAFGPGKADLLEAIETEGSISAAGRSLGMSYRRAWMLVDTMNRCWTERLVKTVPGDGAQLTESGRTVLLQYRKLEKAMSQAAGKSTLRRMIALLRDAPIPPSY